MDTTFKFRFVNEITGLFVLLAVALLATGIYLAGKAQGIFEKKFTLHVLFTSQEGSFGLKNGSEIKILNTPAGVVRNVEPTDDGAISADFVIKEHYHGFIRSDSRALVKKTLVVTGDSFVEISVGNRALPELNDGDSIECVKEAEIVEQVSEFIEELRAKTVPAFDQLQQVLDELPGLAVQTRHTLQQGEILLRDQVPLLTDQTVDTLRETQILLRALQRHWLLKKYVDVENDFSLIDPVNIGPMRLGSGL